MNQDAQITQTLLEICENNLTQNQIASDTLSSYIQFETQEGIKYVIFGNPYSPEPTALISRNGNDDPEYPNGIVFMDGHWFAVDSVEYHSITAEVEILHQEVISARLNAKLDALCLNGLLPSDIKILE